jgi:hypothetical protein
MTITDRRSGSASASTASSRLGGLPEGLGMKAPVKAATTANITLSGAQTIDGVSIVAEDRVLVKDQTTATENGIYDCASGNWTRSPDFATNGDVVEGTRVWVTDGTTNGQTEWAVTTADDITIDTTSIAFSNVLNLTFPSTSAEVAAIVSEETGTGALVFGTSPTLVTPVLGTPASGTLTNCTGLPVGGITGLGTGVGTWLATPSSANLASAVTDETGSGALVFGTTPTFTTSALYSSGFVHSWNSGDVTLTHSSNLLTLAGGDLALSSTTASTSTTTGALVVAGGAGVAGSLYANALVSSTAMLVKGANPGFSGANQFLFDNDGSGTSRFFAFGANASTNGAYLLYSLRSDSSNLISVFSISTAGVVTVPATTASTSTTTGALVVSGGVGIAGDFYAGDDIFLTSGAVLNFDAGDVTLTHGSNVLTIAGGGLTLAAGTTAISPLTFTSGTNLTTAAAGAMEYDGKVFYATAAASSRQVVNADQFIILTSDYTLANSGAQQKLFNAPANGALTVVASTTYQYEMWLVITGMSATSGNVTLSLLGGGTATIAGTMAIFGLDATTLSTSSDGASATFDHTSTVVTAAFPTTGTAVGAYVRGIFRCTGAGTVIPSCALNTAIGTAVVETGSFFRCWAIGSDTVQSVGNWS